MTTVEKREEKMANNEINGGNYVDGANHGIDFGDVSHMETDGENTGIINNNIPKLSLTSAAATFPKERTGVGREENIEGMNGPGVDIGAHISHSKEGAEAHVPGLHGKETNTTLGLPSNMGGSATLVSPQQIQGGQGSWKRRARAGAKVQKENNGCAILDKRANRGAEKGITDCDQMLISKKMRAGDNGGLADITNMEKAGGPLSPTARDNDIIGLEL